MSKTITLKKRGRQVAANVYEWHDAIVLQNACTMLAARKPPAQAMVWGIVASKIVLAMEAVNGRDLQAVEVELSNQESTVLWKALTTTVQNEWYGRNQEGQPAPVSAGLVYLMLCDLAVQLGVEMPAVETDE